MVSNYLELPEASCYIFSQEVLFINVWQGPKCPLTDLFPTHPFSTPRKNQKTFTVFWCFQGVDKGCIENKLVNSPKYALSIRCICQSKLCLCSLALKRSSKIKSRGFERSLNNATQTAPLSSFAPALDKS